MFHLSSELRFHNWRQFRIDLKKLDSLESLTRIAKLWAKAPLCSQYLAADLPETWPTPWELIHDNLYDEVGLALGIFWTVVHSEIFDPKDVKYYVLESPEGIITVIGVNGYILNYDHGEVATNDQIKDLKILYTYTTEDLTKEHQ